MHHHSRTVLAFISRMCASMGVCARVVKYLSADQTCLSVISSYKSISVCFCVHVLMNVHMILPVKGSLML